MHVNPALLLRTFSILSRRVISTDCSYRRQVAPEPVADARLLQRLFFFPEQKPRRLLFK
jgi:hypothetical protein